VVGIVVGGTEYGGWVVEVEVESARMVTVASLARGSKRTSTGRLRLRKVCLHVIGIIM
jgi:hypothetical protein